MVSASGVLNKFLAFCHEAKDWSQRMLNEHAERGTQVQRWMDRCVSVLLPLCTEILCRDLVENIFSQELFEKYKRRWNLVKGKPWQQGMISDFFLEKVTSCKLASASQKCLQKG